MHPKHWLPLLMMLAMPLAHAAPTTPATSAQPNPTAPEQTAQKQVQIAIPAAPADKAQIVFFRSWRALHSVMSSNPVWEGDKQVGVLKNGTYFVHVTEPGTHKYQVKVVHENELKLELKAGQTYYVRENVRVGVLTERPNLKLSDARTFEKLADEIKPVD